MERIVLNAEQTRKFLSFFVQEALEIAIKRLEEQAENSNKEESDS
ncbi:hypothetical protein [Brevibacillus brevis]|nr:hypothetical protein [Brevibacillus brevis]